MKNNPDSTIEKDLADILEFMEPEDVDFYKSLQKVKIKDSDAAMDTCIICYSAQMTIFEEPLKCGHRFHSECIKKWIEYKTLK